MDRAIPAKYEDGVGAVSRSRKPLLPLGSGVDLKWL